MWRFSISLAAAAAMWCGASLRAEESQVEVLRDQTYVRRGERELKADVYRPRAAQGAPAVLVVHGGAWFAGDRKQLGRMATRLAEAGYTAVSIEYRLAPQSLFPAQIEDCKAAVRWMRSQARALRLDAERIGGYGYSAGGQLVALLGTTAAADGLEGADAPQNGPSTRLQCVVAGGAPCDFRLLPPDLKALSYWLGGTRAEKPEQYERASPARFISRDDPPFFFFHGADDRLVPKLSPVAMHGLLRLNGVPSEYHEIPEAGHIEALFDKACQEKVVQFFDRHLKAAGTVGK